MTSARLPVFIISRWRSSMANRFPGQWPRGCSKPPATSPVVIKKVARGLQKAHEAGIIHRDLKPDNIMIDNDREPIVMDFGLAKRFNEDVQVTMTGVIIGTPAYMSPEQVEGDSRLLGPATDIYSLGVILYQMIAGRLPFQGSLTSILRQIGSDPPPRPSALNLGIGENSPLETVCLKMMAKSVQERYHDHGPGRGGARGLSPREEAAIVKPSGSIGSSPGRPGSSRRLSVRGSPPKPPAEATQTSPRSIRPSRRSPIKITAARADQKMTTWMSGHFNRARVGIPDGPRPRRRSGVHGAVRWRRGPAQIDRKLFDAKSSGFEVAIVLAANALGRLTAQVLQGGAESVVLGSRFPQLVAQRGNVPELFVSPFEQPLCNLGAAPNLGEQVLRLAGLREGRAALGLTGSESALALLELTHLKLLVCRAAGRPRPKYPRA